jgi:SAM-dependent methyltransferase
MVPDVHANWAAARSEKWRRHLADLEAMLAPIDDPLVAALALTAPVRVADVGCGGGATTMTVLRHAPAGSVAHGFDLSPALIEVARRRIEVARRRLDGHGVTAAFEVADMGTVAPARPYDRLVSRLGVMFFADPPSAFANLRRWLEPGGRFAFAVWGPLDDNTWLTATRAAVDAVAPLAPVDPSAPGPLRYSDAGPLVALLERAGFVDLTVTDWRQALPIGDRLPAPDAAEFALAAFSSFSEHLAEAGGDAATRARRALTARFAPYETAGGVMMPARIHLVAGRAGHDLHR